MTLEELERSLPNGLHDADLIAVQIDYGKRIAVVELDIDVGSVAGDDPTYGEPTYRRGRVAFSEIEFVVIDPPAGSGAYAGTSSVDSGMDQPATAPRQLPQIPRDCFLCWLFVTQWNSFIRIAARTVSLEWVEPGDTA